MCAVGRPERPASRSVRRAHSPAAMSAAASSAPSDDPHAGAEQALLDRVAHQEDAAERERKAADPDRPLRAEALLEAHAGCRALPARRAAQRADAAIAGSGSLGAAGSGAMGAAIGSDIGGGRRWRWRFHRRLLLRHSRCGRDARAFERCKPRLDPAQLLAEPDGFHQRDDGYDREGQHQQREHDKECVHENHQPRKGAMLTKQLSGAKAS